MNNFENKKVLCVYNSASGESLSSMWLDKLYALGTSDFLNINGVATADITTAIDTYSAATYDMVVVSAEIVDTAANYKLSFDQLALLRAKLKASALSDPIEEGTSVESGSDTSHLVLEDTETVVETNDYYNWCFVVSTGGTGSANAVKVVLDYAGSTRKIEVGGAAWTDPADDTTYEIYHEPNIVITNFAAAAVAATSYFYDYYTTNISSVLTGKEYSAIVWDYITTVGGGVTKNSANALVKYLGTYGSFASYGTAQDLSATMIQLVATQEDGAYVGSTPHGTDDTYNNMWVYIVGGDGVLQWGKITDYVGSTKIATVSWYKASNGTALATADSSTVYRVVGDSDSIFADKGMDFALRVLAYDPTDVEHYQLVRDITDELLLLGSRDSGHPMYNHDKLLKFLGRGEDIFRAVSLSATSL